MKAAYAFLAAVTAVAVRLAAVSAAGLAFSVLAPEVATKLAGHSGVAALTGFLLIAWLGQAGLRRFKEEVHNFLSDGQGHALVYYENMSDLAQRVLLFCQRDSLVNPETSPNLMRFALVEDLVVDLVEARAELRKAFTKAEELAYKATLEESAEAKANQELVDKEVALRRGQAQEVVHSERQEAEDQARLRRVKAGKGASATEKMPRSRDLKEDNWQEELLNEEFGS